MTNPRTLRSSFVRMFLRSLSEINRRTKPSSLSSRSGRTLLGRCRLVKIASYATMASAVGTRRAWSRATLRRIRYGVRRNRPRVGTISRSSLLASPRKLPARKKNKRPKNKKKVTMGRTTSNDDGDFRRAKKKLKKLVPGGRGMELCSLLDETAHYIKCLRTQVEVMRSIADYYTPA